MYHPAPVKRMSILERRAGDTRAFFSRHWQEVHGSMVSRMPHLYAYVQNHVLEDFTNRRAGFAADGIVEQLWRTTRDMQVGYNSPVVAELIADEVNYLGHGSNYAILASRSLEDAPEGNKVIVALHHGSDVHVADWMTGLARDLCTEVLRDDVIATLAKPNFLPIPPRPADLFLHLRAPNVAAAIEMGKELARSAQKKSLEAGISFGVWRTRSVTIVGQHS